LSTQGFDCAHIYVDAESLKRLGETMFITILLLGCAPTPEMTTVDIKGYDTDTGDTQYQTSLEECQGTWEYDSSLSAEDPEEFTGCENVRFALYDASLDAEGSFVTMNVLWNGAPAYTVLNQEYPGEGRFEGVIAHQPYDLLIIWVTDPEGESVCPEDGNWGIMRHGDYSQENEGYTEQTVYEKDDICSWHLQL
jgi:hypothetical protein